MNEQQVNAFLVKTKNTADFLEKKGKMEEARKVRATGSAVASLALVVLEAQGKIKKRPFSCYEMGHVLKGKVAQETYIKHGICVWCDHLASDRYWEN